MATSLILDRDAFSEHLGIPAELPDGSGNPALDEAIVGLMPLDLRVGRGAYENPSEYLFDLRCRYLFKICKRLLVELFLEVFNLFDRQKPSSLDGRLATVGGAAVTSENISDRALYSFQVPTASQAPRRYQAGLRFSF